MEITDTRISTLCAHVWAPENVYKESSLLEVIHNFNIATNNVFIMPNVFHKESAYLSTQSWDNSTPVMTFSHDASGLYSPVILDMCSREL